MELLMVQHQQQINQEQPLDKDKLIDVDKEEEKTLIHRKIDIVKENDENEFQKEEL